MLERIDRYKILDLEWPADLEVSEVVGPPVRMKRGAQILSVGTVNSTHGDSIYAWARVDAAESEWEVRVFFVVRETGQFEGEGAEYVGNTADTRNLNTQVFERVAP